MAHQGPPSLCSTLQATKIGKPEVVRQMTAFHPTVWGDHFLNYSGDRKKVDAWTRKVEMLKEEVRRMLFNTHGSVQEMNLIDDIQRLGVAYHFENEIDEALHRMYGEYTKVQYDDLYAVALRFRLLRQGGYNVSSDVFRNFKDEDGNFKETLRSDVRGMLSLYEAAYLGIQGEDILDEAIVFTSGHLKTIVDHLHPPLVAKVRRALELPLHKRIPRLESRYYISLYQEDESHNDVLLELARLDFNCLQSLHQRELRDLSRWWKDLGLATKYSFARDRLVETYFWILGVYFEPQYTRARAIKTKIMKLLSIIDDIYDAYALFDELEIFTNAVYRWELEALEGLPDYMKACYLALLNTFEQEREHVASTVECYMKEHGVSEEEAYTKLREMIAMGWKDINKACLGPTLIPLPLLVRGTNLPRVIEGLHIHGDGYTHSKHEMKEKVIAVLVDPIPIPM
ncbi:(-)-germacrene D synthase-like [Magnolia sinica]|uniref:(-)-germacrene D synthase-like n=1 Tax=Magnolia sinica TaxID=86752 RepID=UPI002659EACE|nr:(-)-germacrene D synthase-like [Magnolia sinica]